jgi:hypothetical protein
MRLLHKHKAPILRKSKNFSQQYHKTRIKSDLIYEASNSTTLRYLRVQRNNKGKIH